MNEMWPPHLYRYQQRADIFHVSYFKIYPFDCFNSNCVDSKKMLRVISATWKAKAGAYTHFKKITFNHELIVPSSVLFDKLFLLVPILMRTAVQHVVCPSGGPRLL